VKIENGLIQSNAAPAYWLPLTGTPCTNAPSVTPWKKAAATEPPANALSHQWRRSASALKRNSKATPRKTSPISIRMSGR
jgi:hypothetical protein